LENAIEDSDGAHKPKEGYAGELCSRYGIHDRGGGINPACTRTGRRAAKNAGVRVKGTIGVISDCIERHILTAGAVIELLIIFRDNPSEFRIDPDIIDIAITRIKNPIQLV